MSMLNREPMHSSSGVSAMCLSHKKHFRNTTDTTWLDPLLATWGVWWLFSVNYLPQCILHCCLSSLVPQQTEPLWMASPGHLTHWLLLKGTLAGGQRWRESEVRVVLPSLPLSFSVQSLGAAASSRAKNTHQGVEKREPSYTVGGNGSWCSHYGEQYGGSSKN